MAPPRWPSACPGRLVRWPVIALGMSLSLFLLRLATLDALLRVIAPPTPTSRRLAGSIVDYNVVTPAPNAIGPDKCFLVVVDWTFLDEQVQLVDTSLCPEGCCFAQRCAAASLCAEDGGGGGGGAALAALAALPLLLVGLACYRFCGYYRGIEPSLSSIEVLGAEAGDVKLHEFNGCYEGSPGWEYFGQPVFQHDNGRMMLIYDKPNGGWKLRKSYAIPDAPGRFALKVPALDGVNFVPSGHGNGPGSKGAQVPVGTWDNIETNSIGCTLRRLEPYTVTGADQQNECINGEYKRHSSHNSRPVWKNTRNESCMYFEKKWILFIANPVQCGEDGRPLKYQTPIEYRTSFFFEQAGGSPDLPPEGKWKRHRQNSYASAENVTVTMIRPKVLTRWQQRGARKKLVEIEANQNAEQYNLDLSAMQNPGAAEPLDVMHFRAVLRTDILLENFPKSLCVAPYELDQLVFLKEQLDNPMELLQNKPETFPDAVKLLAGFLDFYVKEGLKIWYLEEPEVDSNTIILMVKIESCDYDDLSSWKEKIIKRRRMMASTQGTDWNSFRLERMTVTDRSDNFVDPKKLDTSVIRRDQLPLNFKVQYGRQGAGRVAGEPSYVTDAQRRRNTFTATRDHIRNREAADIKATSSLVGNLTCRELLQFESDIDSEWDIANKVFQLYTQCSILHETYLAPLAEGLKGELAPLKSLLRVTEKMVLRPYEGVPWDVARIRVRCLSMQQVNHTLQLLSEVQGMIIVRVNDRFARPRSGWCDICVYVVFDDPMCCQVVGEVQIVHAKLMASAEETGMFDDYAANRFRAEVRQLKGRVDSAHLPWSVMAAEAEFVPGLADLLSEEDLIVSTQTDKKARDADSLDLALLEAPKELPDAPSMEMPVTDDEDAEFIEEVGNADMNPDPYVFVSVPHDLVDSVTLQIEDPGFEAAPFGRSPWVPEEPEEPPNPNLASKYPVKLEL